MICGPRLKVDLIAEYKEELKVLLDRIDLFVDKDIASWIDANHVAKSLSLASLKASELAGAYAIKHQPEEERA